jgi:ABC-type transport system involved in multi-copper enzyme maturation permease subunit
VPIYEQGYRRYEARGPLRRVRFWPITREALRLVLSRRAFLGLLAMSWAQLLFRVIQIWIVTEYPQAGRLLPVDGRLFGEFLSVQVPFVLLLMVFGGAGLIANDLRTGAILVYLSRPLTRRDYLIGKLAVLVCLGLFVTLVPGLLLYLVGLALAPAQYLTLELWWIAPALVLQSLVLVLVLGLLSLAASSLTRRAVVAGLSFFGLFMGLEMARGVLRQIFDQRWATLLSVQSDLRSIGAALFGNTLRRFESVPWHEAALVLAFVAALCLLVLRARVRAVEIVR